MASLGNSSINQLYGSPEANYLTLKSNITPEVNSFFSIAISFVAIFLFIRSFNR